jgi:AbrB family looped-hinge helix DNA binding protein
MESALSIKGQATIPKAIRDHLHLESGDRIKFFVHPDGSVVILPKLRVTALKGIVRPRSRRVSIDEMENAAAEGAVARTKRAKVR